MPATGRLGQSPRISGRYWMPADWLVSRGREAVGRCWRAGSSDDAPESCGPGLSRFGKPADEGGSVSLSKAQPRYRSARSRRPRRGEAPRACASAYEKQSPMLRAAGRGPFSELRKASRASSACATVTGTTSTPRRRSRSGTSRSAASPRRANATIPASTSEAAESAGRLASRIACSNPSGPGSAKRMAIDRRDADGAGDDRGWTCRPADRPAGGRSAYARAQLGWGRPATAPICSRMPSRS